MPVMHSDRNSPRAIIIGGSVGGLFTATALQAIGWQVDIFERSPHELDSRGGGIVLQGDVVRAFRFAGVKTQGQLGVRSGDRIFLDRSGEVVQRTWMPQTQTSWSMLYAAMKRHLPASAYHHGEQFVRFEQDGERIHAHFANGRVETGDLLIGADGARSAVRQQMLPGLAPRYAGYVAWRGLLEEGALTGEAADVLRGNFAFQQGPDHLLLAYLVPGEDEATAPGRRRWNWVWYVKVPQGDTLSRLLTDRHGVHHAFSLPPGTVKDADAAWLHRQSREQLAPQFQQLVAATPDPFLQAILDLQAPRMVSGRAVLLGDAAFVPRPHTAGGTAKAAANAVALATALRDSTSTDIDAALAAWQAGQLSEGIAMTDWGVRLGNQIMRIAASDAASTAPFPA
ncbi:FAD binding domain-containing protein [Pandoraea communis]|uniref:FAD binding domain-containing protein n=1 Tax=Pandoraea communis TaxID=2508297 RepID=UPI0025A65EDC|nr:FAD binding domain-containing protein [Pandoraea communis]MDM8358411.1 FAD binding domain-containing protein [Pandoraea communis]